MALAAAWLHAPDEAIPPIEQAKLCALSCARWVNQMNSIPGPTLAKESEKGKGNEEDERRAEGEGGRGGRKGKKGEAGGRGDGNLMGCSMTGALERGCQEARGLCDTQGRLTGGRGVTSTTVQWWT